MTFRDRHNERLKEQFLEVIQELGQELLPEDEAVAEAFLAAPHHVSEEQLLDAVEAPSVGVFHVKRVLRLLCELGIAQRTRLGGRMVYEHLHLDNHHDHLVCVRCGRIVEFFEPWVESRIQLVCRKHGFTPLMHKLELRGICPECAARMPETRSLSSCLAGEKVVVREILGGQALRRRLLDLGLPPGTVVGVINAQGPVTLEVRGGRVVLGRGEASSILVSKPVPDSE
mgnify:CR=1 FL=1